MKLNKRTKKIILQKKDYEIVIFKDDYICINGNYLVKSDLIEFEDMFITDKINRGENFGYNFTFNNYLNIDDNTVNITPYIKSEPKEPVRIYDFYYKTNHIDCRILTNVASNQTIFMNTEFTRIMETIEGNITASKISQYSPVLIHDKNRRLLGLFMPIQNRTAENDLHQLIVDNTPATEEVAA